MGMSRPVSAQRLRLAVQKRAPSRCVARSHQAVGIGSTSGRLRLNVAQVPQLCIALIAEPDAGSAPRLSPTFTTERFMSTAAPFDTAPTFTAGQVLVDALRLHGVDRVFCVP